MKRFARLARTLFVLGMASSAFAQTPDPNQGAHYGEHHGKITAIDQGTKAITVATAMGSEVFKLDSRTFVYDSGEERDFGVLAIGQRVALRLEPGEAPAQGVDEPVRRVKTVQILQEERADADAEEEEGTE